MRFLPVSAPVAGPVFALAAVFALSASSLSAKPPVPRQARELSIVEANGKTTLLTSLKGKVVYVQFLFTTCPHCQALSGVLTKLSRELGPQGFQALGVAFDDDVTAPKAALYVRNFGVGFPVGYASRATVQSYLGMTDDDRFVVPQAVIVDRKGVVRAQTDVQGTENLQREDYLRTFISGLLKEGAAPKAISAVPAKK